MLVLQECGGSQNECLAGQIEWIDPSCAVTEWSLWSPCSVSCGSGIKVNTGLPTMDETNPVSVKGRFKKFFVEFWFLSSSN